MVLPAGCVLLGLSFVSISMIHHIAPPIYSLCYHKLLIKHQLRDGETSFTPPVVLRQTPLQGCTRFVRLRRSSLQGSRLVLFHTLQMLRARHIHIPQHMEAERWHVEFLNKLYAACSRLRFGEDNEYSRGTTMRNSQQGVPEGVQC